MTNLLLAGFEWGTGAGGTGADVVLGDGGSSSGLATAEATIKPQSTTIASCKIFATNDFEYIILTLAGDPGSNWLYLRAMFRIATMPDAEGPILQWRTSADALIASLVLDPSGQLKLWDASSTEVGSGSYPTLSTDTWYRVEWGIQVNGASGAMESRVDGVTYRSVSGINLGTTSPNRLRVGWAEVHGTVGKQFYYDDICANSGDATAPNDWPGAGCVVLLLPTADVQRGSWTGGAGGTTNLWDALNNRPPTGTSAETDATQIESADSSGDNSTDEYRGTCEAYSTYAPAGWTIGFARAIAWHGEDASAGTKTGSLSLVSGPAQGAYTAFTYGGDSGALASWSGDPIAGKWRYAWGGVVSGSGTSLSTTPVVAVRKTDTGTRVASVCALGVVAELNPPTTAPFIPYRNLMPPLIAQ